MYIDSHAHISSFYYDDIEEVVKRAKEKKVLKIVNCGTGFNDFDEIIDLSSSHGFYYVLGIHPENINKLPVDYMKKFEKYIKENLSNPKFIGLGEIGLDYYHDKDNIEKQKTAKHIIDTHIVFSGLHTDDTNQRHSYNRRKPGTSARSHPHTRKR